MGATFYAYIEYDDAPEYYPADSVPVPFAHATDRVIDLTTNVGLSHSKDGRFFNALRFPRDPNDAESQIRLQGLPPNVNWRIAEDFGPDNSRVGWFLFPEIVAALDHMQVAQEDLSFGVQVALGIMQLLHDRLGPERVRFVFEYE